MLRPTDPPSPGQISFHARVKCVVLAAGERSSFSQSSLLLSVMIASLRK